MRRAATFAADGPWILAPMFKVWPQSSNDSKDSWLVDTESLFGTSANRRLPAIDIDVKNLDIDVRNVLTQNSLFAFGTTKLVRDARL